MEQQTTPQQQVADAYGQQHQGPSPSLSAASLAAGPQKVRATYDAKMEAIQQDADLHPEVKQQQLAELRQRLPGDFAQAVGEALANMDRLEAEKERIVYPPRKARGTAEELALARLRDEMVYRWSGSPGLVLADYETALRRDDTLLGEVCETIGPSLADPAQREDLRQRIDAARFSRLTPEQLTAMADIVAIRDARDSHSQGWQLQMTALRSGARGVPS